MSAYVNTIRRGIGSNFGAWIASTVTLLMNYWYILFSHAKEKECKAAITINFSVQFILFTFFLPFLFSPLHFAKRNEQFQMEWNFTRNSNTCFYGKHSNHIFYSVLQYTFIFYSKTMALLLDIDLKANFCPCDIQLRQSLQ